VAAVVVTVMMWYAQLQQMCAPDIAAFVIFGISVALSVPFMMGFYFFMLELWRAQSFRGNGYMGGMNLRLFGAQYSLFLAMILYNIITRLQESAGEIIELFLMITLGYMWLLQPPKERYKNIMPMVGAVCTLRFISLLD